MQRSSTRPRPFFEFVFLFFLLSQPRSLRRFFQKRRPVVAAASSKTFYKNLKFFNFQQRKFKGFSCFFDLFRLTLGFSGQLRKALKCRRDTRSQGHRVHISTFSRTEILELEIQELSRARVTARYKVGLRFTYQLPNPHFSDSSFSAVSTPSFAAK